MSVAGYSNSYEPPTTKFKERIATERSVNQQWIRRKQLQTKQRVDCKRRPSVAYDIGDIVWVARHLRAPRRTTKILPCFIGPVKIIKKLSPLTYIVEDSLQKRRQPRCFSVHVSHLKRYKAPDDRGKQSPAPDADHDHPHDSPNQKTKLSNVLL